MYRGEVTPELKKAFFKYAERFGPDPDEYDEICFDDMPHDLLLSLIEKALETDTEIPDLPEMI